MNACPTAAPLIVRDPFEVIDPRFRALALPNTHLDVLYAGCRWAEGPVWFGDHHCLVWSDIPENRMLRWHAETGVSLFRSPSDHSNGNTRDRQGRLVTCEHGPRRVTRTEHDGRITVLAEAYEGRPLNAPNDVVVRSDGSIWFSDPTYGIQGHYEGFPGVQEQPTRNVYRIDPATGALTIMVDDFEQPNGLAFSPDERVLYVADSSRSHDGGSGHHIRAFDVVDGNRIANGRVFAVIEPGQPDGLRVDVAGNVWTSAADGVQVYAPDGTLLGKVRVPETVANLTFGGPKRNRLFITATTSLYAVYVGIQGAV